MPGKPLKLAVLISGNGSNLQSIIDHIQNHALDAQISVVISNKANAYGLKRARDANVATEVVEAEPGDSRESYDKRLNARLGQYQVDLIVLAGFMRIFSDDFVNQYLGRMINIHPSLLPKHKGLNTHQRALDAGDTEHGASVHWVTPALDDGPVIMQSTVTIDDADDAESLKTRVQAQEHLLYPRVIQLIADNKVSYQ